MIEYGYAWTPVDDGNYPMIPWGMGHTDPQQTLTMIEQALHIPVAAQMEHWWPIELLWFALQEGYDYDPTHFTPVFSDATSRYVAVILRSERDP